MIFYSQSSYRGCCTFLTSLESISGLCNDSIPLRITMPLACWFHVCNNLDTILETGTEEPGPNLWFSCMEIYMFSYSYIRVLHFCASDTCSRKTQDFFLVRDMTGIVCEYRQIIQGRKSKRFLLFFYYLPIFIY